MSDDLTISVRKYGAMVPVTIKDGVPQCPHGCGPMRDRGDGNWDCPDWGPIWDEIGKRLNETLRDTDE